jgi:hypothetical protein
LCYHSTNIAFDISPSKEANILKSDDHRGRKPATAAMVLLKHFPRRDEYVCHVLRDMHNDLSKQMPISQEPEHVKVTRAQRKIKET